MERVASSSYLSKSARLREMFLYLCRRVLDESAEDIHEQEVGHRVFGRPADYDTSADNTVRVHASMLRRRVGQYFSAEGSSEPVIIDIPRGNYAPVFRERPEAPPSSEVAPPDGPVATLVEQRAGWAVWVPIGLAAVFAVLALILFVRLRGASARNTPALRPAVQQFWAQMFRQPTDIILDDAALELFQQLTAQQIPLSKYFDRTYTQSIGDMAGAAGFKRDDAQLMVSKRQSNYGNVAILWKLARLAGAVQGSANLRFAREYSHRELAAHNVVLLGNTRSNPWIEAFTSDQAIRWKFDKSFGTYYPVDTSAGAAAEEQYHFTEQAPKPHDGYATISLLPNGTGKALIITGTGGSAVNAALEFITDERSLAQLRSRLPQRKTADFPYFEVLLKVGSRSSQPRDVTIAFCRSPQS